MYSELTKGDTTIKLFHHIIYVMCNGETQRFEYKSSAIAKRNFDQIKRLRQLTR